MVVLAISGLGVMISKVREIRRDWRNSSRPARHLRIRYTVLASSLLCVPIVALALFGAPAWFVYVGLAMFFIGCGGYVALSLIFGFIEGFRGD